MNKIVKPKINNLIDSTFEEYIKSEDLCGVCIKDNSTSNINFNNVTIDSCKFINIDFNNIELSNVSLVDVIFEHCNLSNKVFNKCGIHRVIFKDCKLTGCDFSFSSLNNIEFIDTTFRYGNLSYAKLKNISLKNCDLTELSLIETKIENLNFDNCNLTRADIYNTCMNKVDLSNSNIDNIKVDINSIKGVIVNSYQAISIVSLLGIEVKDQYNFIYIVNNIYEVITINNDEIKALEQKVINDNIKNQVKQSYEKGINYYNEVEENKEKTNN